MKNMPLQYLSVDQQRPAQTVTFDTGSSLQQDFLLYIPLQHNTELDTMPTAGNNWVRLSLAGQGTIYARTWEGGLHL